MNRRDMCRLLAATPAGLALWGASTLGAEKRKQPGRKRKPARRAQPSSAKSKGKTKPKGKVLMPVGDATEVVDTLYPYFRLAEEGFEVVVCGPEARKYHMVTHEVPPASGIPWDITQERPGYHIEAEVAFRDVDPSEYAGLFVSGGRAPEYLRYDKDLMRITRHFFKENKPVAVVCHGVEIVAAAGVLKGRKMTTVGKCALDVTQFGGTFVDEPCVVDGNLISAGTWHDYDTQFMKHFIRQLRKTVAGR